MKNFMEEQKDRNASRWQKSGRASHSQRDPQLHGAGAATCGDRVRGRRGKEREGDGDLTRC